MTEAGVMSKRAWLKRRKAPPRASVDTTTGVKGTGPTPAATSAPAASVPRAPCPAARDCTRSATPATVLPSKMSRAVTCRPAARTSETSAIDTMLSPPREKKSSSMPTRSRPSASPTAVAMTASTSFRGAVADTIA